MGERRDGQGAEAGGPKKPSSIGDLTGRGSEMCRTKVLVVEEILHAVLSKSRSNCGNGVDLILLFTLGGLAFGDG